MRGWRSGVRVRCGVRVEVWCEGEQMKQLHLHNQFFTRLNQMGQVIQP